MTVRLGILMVKLEIDLCKAKVTITKGFGQAVHHGSETLGSQTEC